jgi:choline dehydrogenase-like flavoprotein
MRKVECDVCIIGGGISAAMLAQKLSELRPGKSIVIVEAGERLFDLPKRFKDRQRNFDYGENAWPGDFIEDQAAKGIISRTMAVGGSAMHWGGTCNRFSREDLRLKSIYGLSVNWPIEWEELEKFYCEAERRLGVSGEPSPLAEDKSSEPYPMKAIPLTYNLLHLQKWANESGIPFWATPQAKNSVPRDGRPACVRCNTCLMCPTGARYSPDFTYKQLLAQKKIALHDRTLVRQLLVHDTNPKQIIAAKAVSRATPDETIEYHAPLFVLAAGYCWSSHLLLLSQSSRFPNGLANSSGLVGRYMCGHSFISAFIEVDMKLYPGMYEDYGLISRQFFRCKPDQKYVRHDLRIWESNVGRQPKLRTANGEILFGDALLEDWRQRTAKSTARVRAYCDVHPDRDSSLTLDAGMKNRWGDPLPKIEHKLDTATVAREEFTHQHVMDVFKRLARQGNSKILTTGVGSYLDHPAGGCRMGNDIGTSVCDSYGQTHDHQNLYVVGSPTLPAAGCTNGTLTFVALTLRSAHKIAQQMS